SAVLRFSTKTAVSISPEEAKGTVGVYSRSGCGRDTLGRRLLALAYAKRSAAIAIRKWKEEGHFVQKYELNRIVRELRRQKRYKHALEVCEWMRLQHDICLLPGDYAVHLDLIGKVRGLTSAEKFFEDLPERMRNHTTCSALLHAYVRHGEEEKAEALMEKMSECGFLLSPVPFNHMISLYKSAGDLWKIPGTMKRLYKSTTPDLVTFNLCLAACASQDSVQVAESVLLEMAKAKIEPDWMTHSTMASMYAKNSLTAKAESSLEEMEKRVTRKDRAAYPSLISLYASLRNGDEVLRLWTKMKSLYRKLHDEEYRCMIDSLSKLRRLEEAERVYAEWEAVSPTKDPRIPNLLLAAYVNDGQIERAEEFSRRTADGGVKPSYATWEILARGYVRRGMLSRALESFRAAVRSVRRWDPDEELVRGMLELIEDRGDVGAAEEMVAALRRGGFGNAAAVYKSLLRTYVRAGKMPLVVCERMEKDGVVMDEEIEGLVASTRTLCVSDVPHDI
ncbi:hypothetical protein M569_14638, partial [Genlisea aurea]